MTLTEKYQKLVTERNKLDVQLAQANANIEILLAELRKFDSKRYPQSDT